MNSLSRQWISILKHDLCAYCGRSLCQMPQRESRDRKNFATIEHVIPRVAGGSRRAKHNQVGACSCCNTARGSMPLLHWLLYLKQHDGPTGKLKRRWE